MNPTYDTRIREYITPKRIILQGGHLTGETCLLLEKPTVAAFGNKDACHMKQGSYVLLDFGREISGALRITAGYINGGKSASLHIRFGESVSEAMTPLGEDNAGNDHTPRDLTLTLSALGSVEYGETGFRFVRIALMDEVELSIQGIKAICIHDDVTELGSFRCSDELLNRIWETGVYTVKLNMQNYILDGIKRDRLVWLGDMQPETDTIHSVFGNAASIPRSLDLARDDAPAKDWINRIPTYSMWWIIIQRDYYLQNGDKKYLYEQRGFLEELIFCAAEWIMRYAEDGAGLKHFVDWSAKDSIYEEAGVKSIFILGFEAAKTLCEMFGNKELEALCCKMITVLQNETHPYAGNKQVAALTVLAGMTDAKQVYDEVFAENLTEGLSTFMGYYVLQAMEKAGRKKEALQVIREYYGGMLSLGATTFWEDFDMKWLNNAARIDEPVPEGKIDVHREYGKYCYTKFRHSLCHGWASGSTPFLTRYILGVRVLEPGCRKVEVKPDLCGLKWAKGDYPTPYGVIHVECTRTEDGEVQTLVQAPEEVELV